MDPVGLAGGGLVVGQTGEVGALHQVDSEGPVEGERLPGLREVEAGHIVVVVADEEGVVDGVEAGELRLADGLPGACRVAALGEEPDLGAGGCDPGALGRDGSEELVAGGGAEDDRGVALHEGEGAIAALMKAEQVAAALVGEGDPEETTSGGAEGEPLRAEVGGERDLLPERLRICALLHGGGERCDGGKPERGRRPCAGDEEAAVAAAGALADGVGEGVGPGTCDPAIRAVGSSAEAALRGIGTAALEEPDGVGAGGNIEGLPPADCGEFLERAATIGGEREALVSDHAEKAGAGAGREGGAAFGGRPERGAAEGVGAVCLRAGEADVGADEERQFSARGLIAEAELRACAEHAERHRRVVGGGR